MCLLYIVKEGVECPNDLRDYHRGSVASRRATHARQARSEESDEEGYQALQIWRLGVGFRTPSCKNHIVTKT